MSAMKTVMVAGICRPAVCSELINCHAGGACAEMYAKIRLSRVGGVDGRNTFPKQHIDKSDTIHVFGHQ